MVDNDKSILLNDKSIRSSFLSQIEIEMQRNQINNGLN